ncbi:MAG: histidine--tRNA ligase [bacterium]
MPQATNKQSKIRFQAPKGMKDILPEEQKYWQYILNIAEPLIQDYGFKKIDTPILEETQLFAKGTGQTSDIVSKEMFSLKTKGGDQLSLRPEFTPNICRAYLEHGMSSLPQPVKLYSFGPVFRYDRPQAGRLRQFNQFSIEAINSQDPIVDSQIIQLSWKIFEKLGINKNLTIQINSIGCAQCRPDYIKLLIQYYRNKAKQLCRDCKSRLIKNPLRLLDCKEAICRRLMAGAPQSVDHLCSECHDHFKSVLEYLEELNLPYELNYRLVRGLDYYTKTVFEFYPEPSLGGGGRYDGLIKILGGKETPGVGVALGVERIIAEVEKQKNKLPEPKSPKVFLAQLGSLGKRKALKLFDELQKTNIKTIESLTRDSLKAQLRIADKLGVSFTLILGQKEALENTIILRDMTTGVQEVVLMDKIIPELKKRLK